MSKDMAGVKKFIKPGSGVDDLGGGIALSLLKGCGFYALIIMVVGVIVWLLFYFL